MKIVAMAILDDDDDDTIMMICYIIMMIIICLEFANLNGKGVKGSYFQVVKQVVWKTFTVNLPQILGKPLAQFYNQWFCNYETFESPNNSDTPRLLQILTLRNSMEFTILIF